MIAKGIPGHLVDDAMILMAVVALVAKDQIGRMRLLERFEEALDLARSRRKSAVRKVAEFQRRRDSPGFTSSRMANAGPPCAAPRCRSGLAQSITSFPTAALQHVQGRAAADLDVVAVGADAQHPERRPLAGIEE